MKKDTDQIMNALESAQKAMPSEEFLQKMEDNALEYVHNNQPINRNALISVAASFLILIMTNFYAISNHSIAPNENSIEVITSQYKLIPNSVLYDE